MRLTLNFITEEVGMSSHNLWKATFNSMEEAISIHRVDGTILKANRAFCKLVGLGEEEIIGKKCFEVVHKSLNFPHFCPMKKSIKALDKRSVEVSMGGRHFIVSTYPIVEDSAECTKVVHVIKDVTQLKRAREALKNYAEKLEKANSQRQLLIDIISHDLLNIVGTIMNSQELLLKSPLAQDQRRLVECSLQSSLRMADIIRQASSYSRLEDIDKLSFKEIELVEIINISHRLLMSDFKRKGIRVILPQGKYWVLGDEILTEVFYNLLSNALKYSPEGSTVKVEVKEEPESIVVSVADEGCGIPEEYRETIFDRYVRGGKSGVKGTGLGLAIVKRIVELHNGEVWVEANSPKGSVFKVRLMRSMPKASVALF